MKLELVLIDYELKEKKVKLELGVDEWAKKKNRHGVN